MGILGSLLGSPLRVPSAVFAADADAVSPAARSELRLGLDYHRRKLAALDPADSDYLREQTLVDRFASLYRLVANGALVVEDMSFAELGRYAELTDRAYCRANNLPPRLHRGEAAALAVAEGRNWILATDDEDGLKAALTLKVPTQRTRGLLGQAVSGNLLPLHDAMRLHAEMRANGFWDAKWI